MQSPYARFGEVPPSPLGPVLPLLTIPSFAMLFGFVSGLLSSGKLASLQFRAENHHRRPTTKEGWYFYHKTKNYKVMWAALKGGARTGGRLAVWTASFVVIKEVVNEGVRRAGGREKLGEKINWIGGAAGGMAVASGAGLLYRLKPRISPPRILLGAVAGAAAGGAEDLRAVVRRLRDEEEARSHAKAR